MTDQQRWDTIAALGATHMLTPHMDRMVREGTALRRAYCPGATCVASRAAIFTGMYAHNSGAYTFGDWAHHRTWVQDLADGGYYCASVGKMHLEPRDEKAGFHERLIVENPTSISYWGGHGDDAWGQWLTRHGATRPNHRHRTDPRWKEHFQGVPWEMDESLHSDVFIGDSAVNWIENYRPETGPFFLQIGLAGPHEPWDPPRRHLDSYRTASIPPPVNFTSDLSGKPPEHEAHRTFHSTVDHESVIAMPDATPADIERMRRHYYAKISLVDEQLGKILACLEGEGLLDESVVVLTSDHGEMLGDHGLAYKWLMPESVIRVPLIVRAPSLVPCGVVRDDLVSLIDLGPTFLDWAGLETPRRMEGRSLRPCLEAGVPHTRQAVFCEDNYLVSMVSAGKKLIYYIGQEYGEFYDLEADPGEICNLWAEPAHVPERKEWTLRLLDWLARSSYFHGPAKLGCSDYPVRWPELGDCSLHGGNAKPRPHDIF